MRNIIILFFALFAFHSGTAQELSPRLVIKKSFVNTKTGKINLTCVLINGIDKNIFYKPNHNQDFCLRLNSLKLKDLSNNSEVSYFPCRWVVDFSKIDIDSANSVELEPNGEYNFNLVLNAFKFNNRLKQNHKYEVAFSVNHKDICGSGLPCKAFTGILDANKHVFIYK